MSGNAFKNKEIKRITYNDYLRIMPEINKIFLNAKPLGSAQRFGDGYLWQIEGDIGDLDLAVEMSKERILAIVDESSLFKEKRIFGNTISTLIEIKGKRFHVDIMPTKNLEHESWIMSGGSYKIKGVMRNVLLCFLARIKSEKDTKACGRDIKWTVAFPGGIGLRENGEAPKERVTNPFHIMSTLGLHSQSADIERARTFEGLIDYVDWTQELYSDFNDYSKNQWLYKKQPEVIDEALMFLKTNYIDNL
jgi:hypothetical protein